MLWKLPALSFQALIMLSGPGSPTSAVEEPLSSRCCIHGLQAHACSEHLMEQASESQGRGAQWLKAIMHGLVRALGHWGTAGCY